MDENELKQKFEQELTLFATKYSVTKLKITTLNFEREYRREGDGSFLLKNEKALITSYGRVTKVPIGEGHEFSTYEEAEEAVKKYWSEYYKKTRATRTPEQKAAQAKRQKRYREKYKAAALKLKQQQ